ncbi:L,D-transpeptidase [Actinophytocola algeriensis]|uniref:Lipoprotein-anchoring transpeptidase ErfK/SrfK n=1 Tax=Actinophytocola algeriensis TaxID=1768010 RepID=A0A7W7QE20_9PSEU|nr:L,D-transpeptidase [Actinophytocola algeriensis]MBB4911915.1 lipoprotein-anchoring transpeptidase ErfK/SrfK [Actinophytocola algeriensis]MBE1477593.1 lipoprotein-anchoring transpeptidase ErfK/SrfK [Actinophytocola algeriensis]
MRTRVLAGLAIASLGLVSACASTPTAAPAPTTPPVTTTPTTLSTVPSVPMPPLPKVAAANETIVKEAPPPPAGVPCDAGVDACIDLSANKSWLLADGVVTFGPAQITHGRPGWETPPGTFHVGWKDIDHKSSLFDDAPMPFSVFFNGGIAFHQGSLSDPSHGCIHLSWAAAEAYYNGLAVGDTVQVVP